MMKNYDVSIIVPVYNVEKYIEKCATTLLEQDYESVEYIFVDDCSPDKSIAVLQSVVEKYPHRKDDIKIIANAKNSGSSLTRKYGLDIASGEYIFFVDADDWVELDMVSSLIKKAKEENADIVCYGYITHTKYEKFYQHRFMNLDKANIIKKLLRTTHGSVYDKLIRKSIYKRIIFPNFSYAEDVFLNLQCFLISNQITQVSKSFYNYNKLNENSLTKRSNIEKTVDDFSNFNKTMESFLTNNGLSDLLPLFYQGLVYQLCNIDFMSYIDKISPNANNIKYLWQNPEIIFYKKIVFSLSFLHLEWIVILLKKIYRMIKTKYQARQKQNV